MYFASKKVKVNFVMEYVLMHSANHQRRQSGIVAVFCTTCRDNAFLSCCRPLRFQTLPVVVKLSVESLIGPHSV